MHGKDASGKGGGWKWHKHASRQGGRWGTKTHNSGQCKKGDDTQAPHKGTAAEYTAGLSDAEPRVSLLVFHRKGVFFCSACPLVLGMATPIPRVATSTPL